MVFTVLSISQMGHAMAIRSDWKSLFSQGIFGNKKLVGAVLFTLGLQIAELPTQLMFKDFVEDLLKLLDAPVHPLIAITHENAKSITQHFVGDVDFEVKIVNEYKGEKIKLLN